MKPLKQLLCLGGLILGGLGAAACAGLVVGVWFADARLSRATHDVYEQLEGMLRRAGDRVGRAEQRIDEAALTVEDVHQALGEFAKQQAVDRLRVRLDVDSKAQRLAGLLDQADGWMETTEASVELVRRAIEVANKAGASVDAGAVDQLLEDVQSLRSRLQGARELVDRLRDETGQDGEAGVVRQRLEQAAKLALRVIAALDIVQSRLRQFAARIEQTQRELQDVESRILARIRTAAILLTLLLLWMLVGQLALCRYGWSGVRR